MKTEPQNIIVQKSEEKPPKSTRPPRKLNNRQYLAINHFLAGKTNKVVAKEVGVGRDTISKWTNLPAFKKELLKLQTEALSASVRKIVRVSDIAIDRLEKVLLTEKVAPQTHVLAARAVLEHLAKVGSSGQFDRFNQSQNNNVIISIERDNQNIQNIANDIIEGEIEE